MRLLHQTEMPFDRSNFQFIGTLKSSLQRVAEKGQQKPRSPNTKNQLKTIQKIEHNLAHMDYAMIFCL